MDRRKLRHVFPAPHFQTPSHPRVGNQRLRYGIQLPPVIIPQRQRTLDWRARAGQVLQFQWLHDAVIRSANRLLGLDHRRLHLPHSR